MEKYLIKAGTFIDCVSDEAQKNIGILIENDTIKKIMKFDDFKEECPVVDYSGKTVMPGLFNCHVHMHMDPVTRGSNYQPNEVETVMQTYTHLNQYINSGVTYVRNQGTANFVDLKFKKMIDAGKMTGPSICASGPSICMTGGHGHASGLESDGVDECIKSARYLLKNGVQTVKIMATGGVMTEGVEPGSTQLTYEEIKGAVDEAKKAGKLTSTHAQGAEGIMNSVRAGVTSIEHGIFLTDEIIDLMLEKGTYLVPTLCACHFIVSVGVEGGVPEYAVKKTIPVKESHFGSFRKAYERGVKIVLGTDAGTPFNMHDKTWYELKLFTENGMTNLDALKAGTINAAQMLQVSDLYGTLEEGKKADIIVVEDNPIENIDTMENVLAVYKHGKKLK